MKTFDAIIIGSGQAGNPLAMGLSAMGKKIAFIEKEHYGGTCVNTGCTPTKAYVASARRAWAVRNSHQLGISTPEGIHVNLKQVKDRAMDLVKQSANKIQAQLEKDENITLYRGQAGFVGPKQISVNGLEITAEKIYINVGARPTIPNDFKELPYLTNESILQIEDLPKHLIIVGGSYNGLEFGQMFCRFGSNVTIIEREDRIAQHEDNEISKSIMEFLKEEGVQFRMNANCIGGRQNSNGTISMNVDCTEGEPEITGTHVLLAVGRTPNSDTLNLKASGLETDKKGYLKVNDYLETNVKGIYALGECNGKGAFTHTAYNDFEIIINNLKEEKKRKVSDRIPTYALFTDPPLGRAGMTRKAALEKDIKIKEAFLPMSDVARAKEKGETKGLMHILTDAGSGKIVGAAILGISGDEVISSILHVMYADIPWNVISKSVKPHPTVSELLPSLLMKLEEIN